MKYCPKCNKEYASGNFCENCENEDGSPVRLLEKMVAPAGNNSGISTGKVVTGGDFNSTVNNNQQSYDNSVHNNQTYHNEQINNTTNNVTNTTNTTNIHYNDETKKMLTCHVCGKQIVITNAYTCKKCGQATCADCFSTSEKVCFDCAVQKHNIQEVSNLVQEFQKGLQNCSGEKITREGITFTDDTKKHEYITSYVIPNNKSDIYSFIYYGLEQFKGAKYDTDKNVWGNKIISVYEQAERSFNLDRKFMNMISRPAEVVKKFQKKQRAESIRKAIFLNFLSLITLAISAFFVIRCQIKKSEMTKVESTIPNVKKIPSDQVYFTGLLGNYLSVSEAGATMKYLGLVDDEYCIQIMFELVSNYDFKTAKENALSKLLNERGISTANIVRSGNRMSNSDCLFNTIDDDWGNCADCLKNILDMKKNDKIRIDCLVKKTANGEYRKQALQNVETLMGSDSLSILCDPYYYIDYTKNKKQESVYLRLDRIIQ